MNANEIKQLARRGRGFSGPERPESLPVRWQAAQLYQSLADYPAEASRPALIDQGDLMPWPR